MESSFGIIKYVSEESPRFNCVLKQRYQDFIVHEIDECGNVVQLTELKATPVVIEKGSDYVGECCEDSRLSAADNEKLKKLKEGELCNVDIECQDFEKSARTEIHEEIRKRFNGSLESKTVTENGCTFIRIEPTVGKKNSRKRKFWDSERLGGDFCKFVLYKENKDSGEATAVIAKFLHIRQISIAGTKDRRGVTSQLATAYRVEAETLSNLNSRLFGIRLGNFNYCQNDLRLGALKGNRFSIVLRNVDESEENIERCVKNLQNNGFINYYGAQRFGTSSISTHSIGKAILTKKWAEAIDLILSPREGAFGYLEQCYNVWTSTKNASEALNTIPNAKRDTSIEGMLLKALKKSSVTDFASALYAIPRNTRNLYVHSFQSLLWNKLVCRRVEKFGTRLLCGDFVSNDKGLLEIESTERRLTSEDLELSSSFDLLLPFFSGPDCLPDNEVKVWYDEILKEEDVTWENFKECSKEYALHGGLRRVFVLPIDFEYEILRYDDPNKSLTLTDLDKINGKCNLEKNQCGKYLALKLDMSLPAGCYATMALREIMKNDSSKQHQSTLNDYAIAAAESADSV